MLCSQIHSSGIQTRTVNMNWWVLNCKACYPAQNSISHRYLILPFITKSSKRLDWGGNKLFCPIFHPAPGYQIQFSTKSLQWERKENKHTISVQRWISNSLERGWWRRVGRDWLELPPASAAFWLQPNVKALSQNGHPVWEFPEISTNADKLSLIPSWICAVSGNLRICSWMSVLGINGYWHALETLIYSSTVICKLFCRILQLYFRNKVI